MYIHIYRNTTNRQISVIVNESEKLTIQWVIM